jgi:hypothetical protein
MVAAVRHNPLMGVEGTWAYEAWEMARQDGERWAFHLLKSAEEINYSIFYGQYCSNTECRGTLETTTLGANEVCNILTRVLQFY